MLFLAAMYDEMVERIRAYIQEQGSTAVAATRDLEDQPQVRPGLVGAPARRTGAVLSAPHDTALAKDYSFDDSNRF